MEVLSPGTVTRDRKSTFQLYGRHGVPRYWIAAPDARRLEMYELSGASYVSGGSLDHDGVLSAELFPGLTITGSAIWA
ncbi:MAG: Uma2 family endonuclease [Candidatus Methylomirabilia bacterium]